jgi:hypothetical protein
VFARHFLDFFVLRVTRTTVKELVPKLQDECGWADTLYTVKEHEELCVPEATAGRNSFKYESSYDFGQGMDS